MDPGRINHQSLMAAYHDKNFHLDIRSMFVNVFGVRSADMTPDVFNDYVGLLAATPRGWIVHAFAATTEPGLYYLRNPINVNGTGVVVPGQYIGSHAIGKHKGQYTALVQVGPVKMYRDKNKDDKFDLSRENIVEGSNFGMNIHRSNAERASTVVDKWSAACQVLSDPANFETLMAFCVVHKEIYENLFSYTLFEKGDFP